MWTLAAPSFIWPARVGENCRRLHGVVDEVGLVFFEARGCLEYTAEDLPPWLPDLDLSYHVHLPLDLPWERGPEEAAETAVQLALKTAFCRPWGFVLHPPQDPHAFLAFHRHWVARGQSSRSLLLENIEENDLLHLLPAVARTKSRICLDIGHLSAFNQWPLMDEPLLAERLAMVHLYAPVNGHTHAALPRLQNREQEAIQTILGMLPRTGVVVLEVFSWPDLQASLDIFSLWIRKWNSPANIRRKRPG